MTQINNENNLKMNVATISKKVLAYTLAVSLTLPHINNLYANPEEGERAVIRIYPKSFNLEQEGIRNLIAPSYLNVEYIEINSTLKTLTAFPTDKDPQEIESLSNFPWQLSKENMENFLSSQSIHLKQLSDGALNLDMHTVGKGGILPLVAFLATPAAMIMIEAIGLTAVVAWYKHQQKLEKNAGREDK